MKKLSVLGLFVLLCTSAFAQKPEITFESKSYDFGEIKEENGPVSTVFEFVNTGAAPLVINGVTASCGCTTPAWTKEPVRPGDKGQVKATYSVVGRPGPFRKTITVRSNASEGTTQLTISGTVIPRPKTVEEEYPVSLGAVRLKTRTVPQFDLYRGDTRTERIQLKNISDKDVKLTYVNAPKHIIVETNPSVVKPGETANILITYNSKNIDDYGTRVDAFNVLVGDEKATDDNKVIVNSNLREDFRNLSASDLQNAPEPSFGTKVVKVEMAKDEKKMETVSLKNEGKSNLVIRKIVKSKGISKVSSAKTIAPGKTATIKLELNSAGMEYDAYEKVTIITNSPKNTTTVIPVNIKIKK